jgi:hypothetical protein
MVGHNTNLEALSDNFWKLPDSYFGPTFYDYIEVYGRHRDSKLYTNVNFECILRDLEKLTEETVSMLDSNEPMIQSIQANHWAVGWIETILVHKQTSEVVLNKVYEILGALENYPLYNEDAISEAEYNEINKYWYEVLNQRDRIEICSNLGLSIFSSRTNRDRPIPDMVFYDIRESIL